MNFCGQIDQDQDQDYKTKTLTQYYPRAQCTQYEISFIKEITYLSQSPYHQTFVHYENRKVLLSDVIHNKL